MTTEPIHLLVAGRVAAPPSAVWDVVADLARRPEWLVEVRRVDDGEGPADAGARFVGQASLLGHDLVGHGVVHQADEGRTLVEEIVLGARFTSTWTFEPDGPDGGSTRVAHALAIDFPRGPFGRLERWLIRRRLVRMQRASLAALAELAGRR